MRIGIDVDGVLRDTMPAVLDRWFEKTGERKFQDSITDWSVHKFLGLDGAGMMPDDFYAWWFNNAYIYSNAIPIDGSVVAVARLAESNELFVVSSQPTLTAKIQTISWLDRFFRIRWAGIYFGSNKGILELDVLIDDYWENLEASATWRGLLFDRPWNRHISGYERVTWPTVVKIITTGG